MLLLLIVLRKVYATCVCGRREHDQHISTRLDPCGIAAVHGHSLVLDLSIALVRYIAVALWVQLPHPSASRLRHSSLCLPTQEHKRKLGADVDLGGYVAAATAT